MASDASTTFEGGIRFTADFVANIPRYQQAIRGHRAMSWARRCSLDDDLIQLTLIDLARVESRYDPARATSPHHFRLAVLGSRVSDCAQRLMRMHQEITGYGPADDTGDSECIADTEPWDADVKGDPVFERAFYAEVASTVREAITTLSTRQREVIGLALEDYTDREIAKELGVSVQAVNKCRLAAITALRGAVLSRFSATDGRRECAGLRGCVGALVPTITPTLNF